MQHAKRRDTAAGAPCACTAPTNCTPDLAQLTTGQSAPPPNTHNHTHTHTHTHKPFSGK